jgi:hypothetical protein
MHQMPGTTEHFNAPIAIAYCHSVGKKDHVKFTPFCGLGNPTKMIETQPSISPCGWIPPRS